MVPEKSGVSPFGKMTWQCIRHQPIGKFGNQRKSVVFGPFDKIEEPEEL